MGPVTLERVNHKLSRHDRIQILLEEYRSLNALLLFRLSALDRRLPLSTAFLAISAASMLAVPYPIRMVVLCLSPLAVAWLARTTVQHAIAKEDHLRRIDEIERRVNQIAEENLLLFQSKHPNQRATTAGRSGQASVKATVVCCIAVVCLCAFIVLYHGAPSPFAYVIYVLLVTVDIICSHRILSRYEYRTPSLS